VTFTLGGNKNIMTEYFNDLNKISDEELIAIANGNIPYFLSAKSTTTPQDVIIEAKSILHKRKKEYEKDNLLLQTKNLSLQKWNLRATILAVIIAGITLAFVVFQFFQNSEKVTSKHEQTHINQTQK
jgi:hypothetical protein